jgi:FkbM family methyltransferase
MPLRNFAERILRDRTRRRTLPQSVGGLPVLVSSAGGLALLLKPMEQVDPELFATARALVRPGDTVWDMGANCGLFTFAAAGIAATGGQVIAFEPDTSLVALLRRSQQMQPGRAAAVSIVPCGVAGVTGLRSFAVAARARASNALAEYGRSQQGGARELQTIMCLGADACLEMLPRPDVLKIDIEGAEVELLEGATRLLGTARPVIAVEVGPANVGQVTAIFARYGYMLFDGPAGLASGRQIGTAVWNTIGVPQEKASNFLRPDLA